MISVLLVDDEPVILDIARAFLERHGEFSVTTVLSAEEGLALLNEQDFDAVVSDYEMPVMNGLGFSGQFVKKEAKSRLSSLPEGAGKMWLLKRSMPGRIIIFRRAEIRVRSLLNLHTRYVNQ